MNKLVIAMLVGLVLVLTLGTVGFAYAQAPTQTPGAGTGASMMGGRGPRGGMTAGVVGEGILHDYMVAAFAEKLNIPSTDLEARLDQGETIAQIAFAQGFTFEQFRTLMVEVRAQAIDQALKDGKLTQQQADWMKQRGAGRMAASGMGNARGMRGAGQGQFANPGCPYYSQTNP